MSSSDKSNFVDNLEREFKIQGRDRAACGIWVKTEAEEDLFAIG